MYAYITDKGLARRLGEEVALTKRKDVESRKRTFGTLIFFPDKYALLQKKEGKEEVIPIKHGDLIGLRTNDVAHGRNYMPDYVYEKN